MSTADDGTQDADSPDDQGGKDELFAEPSGSSTNVPETPPQQPDEPDDAATP